MPIVGVSVSDEREFALASIRELGLAVKEMSRVPLVLVEGRDSAIEKLGELPFVLDVVEVGEAVRTVAGIDVMFEVAAYNATAELDVVEPYPVLLPEGVETLGEGLSTPYPQMAAINLSLTPPSPIAARDDRDPVSIATRAASEVVPVVMAAGNDAELITGRESMSAWAEAPWVIAVGATTTEAGDAIASYSSRGIVSDPTTGPDVVAWGQSDVPPYPDGTSFAAPRAARQLAVFAAFLLTLREVARRAVDLPPLGIPLVGAGVVDWGIRKGWRRGGRHPLFALPIAGFESTAVANAVDETGVVPEDIKPAPEMLRRMLERSAVRILNSPPHESGKGFVSDHTTESYLLMFDAAELQLVVTGQAPQSELSVPICESHELQRLIPIWKASMFIWGYDSTLGKFEEVE